MEMSNFISLLDWMREHPGYEVEIRYIPEEEPYWLVYMIFPRRIPGITKFKMTDEALLRFIDICKGGLDGGVAELDVFEPAYGSDTSLEHRTDADGDSV